MITISIDREISSWWGIREKDISEQLKAAQAGEEIEILINSPGGECYEGIAIFNLIREYAKSHNITVKIRGLAASMASYIALAARTINKEAKIIVYENSIFLIHNPWSIMWGDYRELAREAEILEKLAAMFGSTYTYISGKTEKETRALMDAETYFFGNEIIENGYANEIEKINKDDGQDDEVDKNTLTINAKLRVEKAIETLRINAKNIKHDFNRAAALINTVYNPGTNSEAPISDLGQGSLLNPASDITAGGGVPLNPNSNKGVVMNKEELKKKYPELYAEIYNEGIEAGKKEERERVEAHLKLGEENNAMKVAAKFIREGNQLAENKVQAEYLSAMKNAAMLNARNGDNPPPVNPANGQDADDAAIMEAWKNGLSGKDERGAKLDE
jgi:ATP-dependent protease ClpP protease subunit